MESLDLLWELQKHDNTLKEIKDTFEEILNGDKTKAISFRLKKAEMELVDLENRMDESDKSLTKNNTILKEYDYQLKKIEKELYDGTITDLKQLGFLDKERELLRNQISEREIGILTQMENIEELKEEFIRIKEDFESLRKEYSKLSKEYKIIAEELKKRAKEEKEKMKEISSKLKDEILEEYIQLTKSRGTAIVEVLDHKCSGCHVMLPTYVVDRLKNYNEIIHCENCNRILYFDI